MKFAILVLLSAGVCLGGPVDSGKSMGMRMGMTRPQDADSLKGLPEHKLAMVKRDVADKADKDLKASKNITHSVATRDTDKSNIKDNSTEVIRPKRDTVLDKKIIPSVANRTTRSLPNKEDSGKKNVTRRDTMLMRNASMMLPHSMMRRAVDKLSLASNNSKPISKRETPSMKLEANTTKTLDDTPLDKANTTKREVEALKEKLSDNANITKPEAEGLKDKVNITKREADVPKEKLSDLANITKPDADALKDKPLDKANTTKRDVEALKEKLSDNVNITKSDEALKDKSLDKSNTTKREALKENLSDHANITKLDSEGKKTLADHNVTIVKRDTMRGMKRPVMVKRKMMKRETGDLKPVNNATGLKPKRDTEQLSPLANQTKVITKGEKELVHNITRRDTMGMSHMGMGGLMMMNKEADKEDKKKEQESLPVDESEEAEAPKQDKIGEKTKKVTRDAVKSPAPVFKKNDTVVVESKIKREAAKEDKEKLAKPLVKSGEEEAPKEDKLADKTKKVTRETSKVLPALTKNETSEIRVTREAAKDKIPEPLVEPQGEVSPKDEKLTEKTKKVTRDAVKSPAASLKKNDTVDVESKIKREATKESKDKPLEQSEGEVSPKDEKTKKVTRETPKSPAASLKKNDTVGVESRIKREAAKESKDKPLIESEGEVSSKDKELAEKVKKVTRETSKSPAASLKKNDTVGVESRIKREAAKESKDKPLIESEGEVSSKDKELAEKVKKVTRETSKSPAASLKKNDTMGVESKIKREAAKESKDKPLIESEGEVSPKDEKTKKVTRETSKSPAAALNKNATVESRVTREADKDDKKKESEVDEPEEEEAPKQEKMGVKTKVTRESVKSPVSAFKKNDTVGVESKVKREADKDDKEKRPLVKSGDEEASKEEKVGEKIKKVTRETPKSLASALKKNDTMGVESKIKREAAKENKDKPLIESEGEVSPKDKELAEKVKKVTRETSKSPATSLKKNDTLEGRVRREAVKDTKKKEPEVDESEETEVPKEEKVAEKTKKVIRDTLKELEKSFNKNDTKKVQRDVSKDDKTKVDFSKLNKSSTGTIRQKRSSLSGGSYGGSYSSAPARAVPLKRSYEAPQAPVRSTYEAPKAPVRSTYEAPKAPVRSPYEAPKAPVRSTYEAPKAPVRSTYEAPKAPVRSTYEAPKARVRSTYEAPKAPVRSTYEAPKAPVRSTYEAPKAPVRSTYEAPKAPVVSTYEAPKAPVRSTYEDPKTPVRSTYEAPKAPVRSTYEAPKAPVRSSYEAPQAPVKASYESIRGVPSRLRMVSM